MLLPHGSSHGSSCFRENSAPTAARQQAGFQNSGSRLPHSTIPLMKTISIFTSIFLTLPAFAQDASTTNPTEVGEVVVTGKAEDLLGVAPAASKGQASNEELTSRPVLRRGEILETIPGVVVTQHAGGGKANQYFLRGFNLDHGTDFATSLEGMPLNMRTHAHGQGYTDLNPLLPELIERVDYVKGTYTAANGDLSTAGSADFTIFNALNHNLATVEFGEHNYYRALIAGTLSLDVTQRFNPPCGGYINGLPQNVNRNNDGGKSSIAVAQPNDTPQRGLTYAFEYNYYDGPWVKPENFSRGNVLLRYFDGSGDDHFSLTFMGYKGRWNSSDQVASRAIKSGLIDRFGSLDDTTGGDSQRYSLNAVWQHQEGNTTTKANVFAIYYDLDLYSDFTYFLDNPTRGDQFNQAEKRWVFGGNIARTWERQTFFGKEADFTVGVQTRHDVIDPIGLYKTADRQRLSTVREDGVYEASIGAFADSTVHWAEKFRTNIGLRGDLFFFDTSSNLAANSGQDWSGIVSPKFSAIFGPWSDTELYLNYGMGFHSNDSRGVNNTVDPTTHEKLPAVTPLVRTQGAELGIRTQAVQHLTSTLTFFWLQSDSELVYVGDEGVNEPGPGSNRYGIEWTNYWRPTDWFSFDGEIAITRARFTDSGKDDHIPDSVPLMFSGGITLGAQGDADGVFASLRARAFAKRPLIEDNSVQGKPSFLVNAALGYRHQNWEAVVECLNLFDRKDNDIEYFYTSRLQNERAAGYDDIHLHPTEPRTFRLRVTYKF